MKYGRIDGVEKDVSRLVMGVIRQEGMEPILDEFFERGGNCFDTAYIYGTQQFLGEWIKDRNVRDKAVIFDKRRTRPTARPTASTSRFSMGSNACRRITSTST